MFTLPGVAFKCHFHILSVSRGTLMRAWKSVVKIIVILVPMGLEIHFSNVDHSRKCSLVFYWHR